MLGNKSIQIIKRDKKIKILSSKVLVIGRSSPVGGVTTHILRSIAVFEEMGYPFEFVDVKRDGLISIVSRLGRNQLVHIHLSNTYARLGLVLACRLFRKKVLVTFHGNLGRYGRFRNFMDLLSVRLCSLPIVLNRGSELISKRANPNTVLISAYVPPVFQEFYICPSLLSDISFFAQKYPKYFVTNAYAWSLDKLGNDLYGIFELVEIFANQLQLGLIVVDPSGDYTKKITQSEGKNDNILFINTPLSFVGLLRNSAGVIRATSTDGDSLSVREGLDLGVAVLATNCVSRPEGVLDIGSRPLVKSDVLTVVEEVLNNRSGVAKSNQGNGAIELVELYNAISANH